MKITATATITYDTDTVISELKNDWPEDEYSHEFAKDMILNWIKDDFVGTMADVVITEES